MKRGQAAIELLSTYGWMLVAVLIIIAAIIQFGVFDEERYLAQRCSIPSGIKCIDFSQDEEGMHIILRNEQGFDVINLTTSVNGTGCVMDAVGPTTLLNGEQGTYWFNCTLERGAYQGQIYIDYVSQDTLNPHFKMGDIILKVA